MEEDDVISHDVFHYHPLRRIPNLTAVTDYTWEKWCFGCWRYFLSGEAAYGCSIKCGYQGVLHEECMEMPREIRHPLHHPSSHTLTLKLKLIPYPIGGECAVCEENIMRGLSYKCTNANCEFWIHMGCAGNLIVDEDEKHPPLNCWVCANPSPTSDVRRKIVFYILRRPPLIV